MSAPRGKAIYDRGNPSIYQAAGAKGASDYAAKLGCDWIAIHGLATAAPDEVQMAFDHGLKVYLWSGPSSWTAKGTWKPTFAELAERADRWNVAGIIADVECVQAEGECTGPFWAGRRGEALELGQALGGLADAGMSVGFTTFPYWPYWEEIAATAGKQGAWGNPQLYGLAHSTPDQLPGFLDRWKRGWPGPVLPAIAGWDRSPEQQRAYQQMFRGERGGIYWTVAPPAVGSPGFRALRDMGFAMSPLRKVLLGAFVGAVGYGAWRYGGDFL